MSRTVIIIFIIFTLTVGAVVGTYFFFLKNSTGETSISIRDIFPFGQGGEGRDTTRNVPFDSTDDEFDSSLNDAPEALPLLRQLYERPVAGAITFEDTGTSTIRFVERETGHVFEMREDERVPRRVTNTTLPRIQEALWANSETVLVRYLNDEGSVQTYIGNVSPSTEEGELVGTFLAQDAMSPAVRSGAVFYTVAAERRGYVQNLAERTVRSVLPTSFTEWLPAWLSPTKLALTSKPSASALSTLYFLNTQTGTMERILGNRYGFTTLVSPETNRLLFSESTGSGFSLGMFDIDTAVVKTLPQQTLPEKCTWSSLEKEVAYCGIPESIPPGKYPDRWYQGRVSFSDSIWKMNVEDGTSELLIRPGDAARTAIDLVEPHLTEDESHLVFINKKDGTLWSLSLPKEAPSTQ